MWGVAKQDVSFYFSFAALFLVQIGCEPARIHPSATSLSLQSNQRSLPSLQVCVCLFNNSVGMLITGLCCCSCKSSIASHIPPTSVFSHSAQLSGNSHLLLTFTCLAIKELINAPHPCFLGDEKISISVFYQLSHCLHPVLPSPCSALF